MVAPDASGVRDALMVQVQPLRETRAGNGGNETRGDEMAEERTEQQIQIRQVTHVQASWTEQERGGDGAFTFQLILDQGTEEYVIRPTADDADVLLELFERSDSATFDMGRKVLIFNNLSV